ncbi:hypothetical protein HZQ44_18460, partial [Elizabethkingia anophelis]|nr:hypothetical protein [Elizabethkingia anophelis]MCT3697180.1 hypothetical protein [Elizabethkingia anophelis]MCT3861133.1 hypothetical protein [Elizabethkingia anophelis]MCT3914380.1 hypothetical protein [Elizabethkingia anophelis]MCT4313497.1 hypothetical protein [Elizabethkingia anophelis]
FLGGQFEQEYSGQFEQECSGHFAQESTDHFRRISMVNFEGFYRITKGLVMGILENEETNLRYVRLEESYEGYSGIIQNFSKNDKKVRISDLAIAAMKKNDDVREHPDEPKRDDENGPANPPEKTIPEVIIIVPAPLPTVPTIPIIPNVPVIPPGGGGCGAYGGCNPPPPNGGGTPHAQQDPCSKAKAPAEKATKDYKSSAVQAAKTATQNAYNNDPAGAKNEHVTMIHSENGNLVKGETYHGNSGSVTGMANSSTVGDIHNHNDDLPPSPGDVYSLMEMANYFQNYRTKFVYTQQGTEYALVVTDIEALRNFLKMYPPNRSIRNGRPMTNFPANMNIEYNDIAFDINDSYNKDSFEVALPYILDKYNAGVSLTKMDGNGNFKKINVERSNTNGITTYTQKPCN